MNRDTELVFARHADGTEERESAYKRLRVVGKAQSQPIESPLHPDWEARFPEAVAAVKAAQAGLSPVESQQPAPVQGVLRQESPVLP